MTDAIKLYTIEVVKAGDIFNSTVYLADGQVYVDTGHTWDQALEASMTHLRFHNQIKNSK